jgi:hypothetical protein
MVRTETFSFAAISFVAEILGDARKNFTLSPT